MTNTKDKLIAKRYSDALLELVREYNMDIKSVKAELDSVAEALKGSAELSDFMLNPVISQEDKKEVISKLFDGKVDVVLIRFMKLLIEKERFSVLGEISEAFSGEVDNIDNIKKVSVISAIEMRDELKQRLAEKLSSKLNKNVELITEVDSSIIAGLVIKIDDNVIDMSLKHKFEEMNKEMIK